jgi:predicted  nucleic acid-binding Zn-ribbon protein
MQRNSEGEVMEKTVAEYQKEIDLAVARKDKLQDEIDWLNNRIRVREEKIKNLEFAEQISNMRFK